jgi:hypothetical protein
VYVNAWKKFRSDFPTPKQVINFISLLSSWTFSKVQPNNVLIHVRQTWVLQIFFFGGGATPRTLVYSPQIHYERTIYQFIAYACWTICNYVRTFESVPRSKIRIVRTWIGSCEEYFDHLLWIVTW